MSPDDTIALAPLLCVRDLKIILEMLCCLFASSLSVITSLCFAGLGILARFSWFLLGAPESWILIDHSHVRAEFYELYVLVDFEPLEKRVKYIGGLSLWKKKVVGDKHLAVTKGSVKK